MINENTEEVLLKAITKVYQGNDGVLCCKNIVDMHDKFRTVCEYMKILGIPYNIKKDYIIEIKRHTLTFTYFSASAFANFIKPDVFVFDELDL